MLGVEAFRRLLDRESFPVGPDDLAPPGIDVDMVQCAEDHIKRLDRVLTLGRSHPVEKVIADRVVLERVLVLDGPFRAWLAHRTTIAQLVVPVAHFTVESTPITRESTSLQ